MFSFIKKISHAIVIFFLAVIFSYFLLFLFLHPLNVVFFLGNQLSAAAGLTNTATVAENPINRLAMQLDEKQKQLDDREQALNDRATALDSQNNLWNNGLLLAILLALVVLGVLLMINFYFDRRREKELQILAEREISEKTLAEDEDENSV
jgi:hypothetical protein